MARSGTQLQAWHAADNCSATEARTGNARGERGLATLTSSQSAADVEDVDKTIQNATIPDVKFFKVCKVCKELATTKLDVESKGFSVFHQSSRTFVMKQQLKLHFFSLHLLML